MEPHSNPSWYSCEMTKGGSMIKARVETSSEEIIKSYITQTANIHGMKIKDDVKLYNEIDLHNVSKDYFKRGDQDAYGLQYDVRDFENREPAIIIDKQTIIPEDPTLLWIGRKTYANTPERCEQLAGTDERGRSILYFFDPKKVQEKEVTTNTYLDVSTQCKTIVTELVVPNKWWPSSEKRLTLVKGVDISNWGVVATGENFSVDNVYIPLTGDRTQAMKMCIDIRDNGFKVGNNIFKIKDRLKIQMVEKTDLDNKAKEIFPNGIWKSNDDKSCSQVDIKTLDNIMHGLTNHQQQHWYHELPNRVKYEQWELESELYKRTASTGTHTKSFFGGYTYYDSKNGLHWENIKTGKGKNDWKVIYYAPTKELCESATKDKETLSADDFREKYFIERK